MSRNNDSDLKTYSKDKYAKSFSSNIFNRDEERNQNNIQKIKVNRKQDLFTPKFKEENSLQRKLKQLRGSLVSNSSMTSIHSNKSNSKGIYNKEITNKRVDNYKTATERYYASLSESVSIFNTNKNSDFSSFSRNKSSNEIKQSKSQIIVKLSNNIKVRKYIIYVIYIEFQ